jgi:hypothetical protein
MRAPAPRSDVRMMSRASGPHAACATIVSASEASLTSRTVPAARSNSSRFAPATQLTTDASGENTNHELPYTMVFGNTTGSPTAGSVHRCGAA